MEQGPSSEVDSGSDGQVPVFMEHKVN